MANDSWRTPPQVFNNLNKEFRFAADMAADHDNHLHDVYFTEEVDSLSFDWSLMFKDQYVWLNPPYSNPKPFVKHVQDCQSRGVGCVMLLNNDTSPEWFEIAYNSVGEIRCIFGGRLAFIDASTGEPVRGNNKPQFLLIFHPYDDIKSPAPITTYIHIDDIMTDE